MIYRVAADGVLVLHLLFILYVVFGGLLVFRWARTAWIHLPVAAYGALIEFVGWVCPLTPVENELRRLAGEGGYEGGFIEHYLLPLIYPGDFTRTLQIVLGTTVVALNVVVYAVFVFRQRRDRDRDR